MNTINSTVDKQEIDKFSQHANQWWDKEGPLKTLHDINQTRLDFILEQVNVSNINVLDVGCGGGILSELMAKNGAKVAGLDAEELVIKIARNHAKEHNVPIEYICSPLEVYEHALFDVITCMELLEHVSKPELILQHCKRLLKPGGLIFLSTINRTLKAYATAIVAAEYLLNLLPRQTHDFQKFIQPSELASMARKHGLQLIKLKGLDYNPITRTASLSSNVSVNYLMAFRGD